MQLVCSEFGAIRCWNVSRSPKSLKNYKKPLFWRSRSPKVIEFNANRKPVYDFLLIINSNLGPIWHRYWDTATYWLNIANCSFPLSFNALVRGDALRFLWKSFTVPETRVFQAADVEDGVIISFWLIYPCDGQTDRRTDRIAMAKTH